MKYAALTFLSFILTTIIYGKEIKISIAPTISIAPHYQSVLGGPGQKAKSGFSSTLDYLLRNDKRISFGLGISYQFSRLEFIPNLDIVPFRDENLPYRLTTAAINVGLVFGPKKDLSLDK